MRRARSSAGDLPDHPRTAPRRLRGCRGRKPKPAHARLRPGQGVGVAPRRIPVRPARPHRRRFFVRQSKDEGGFGRRLARSRRVRRRGGDGAGIRPERREVRRGRRVGRCRTIVGPSDDDAALDALRDRSPRPATAPPFSAAAISARDSPSSTSRGSRGWAVTAVTASRTRSSSPGASGGGDGGGATGSVDVATRRDFGERRVRRLVSGANFVDFDVLASGGALSCAFGSGSNGRVAVDVGDGAWVSSALVRCEAPPSADASASSRASLEPVTITTAVPPFSARGIFADQSGPLARSDGNTPDRDPPDGESPAGTDDQSAFIARVRAAPSVRAVRPGTVAEGGGDAVVFSLGASLPRHGPAAVGARASLEPSSASRRRRAGAGRRGASRRR